MQRAETIAPADEHLLAGAKQGEQTAFAELVRQRTGVAAHAPVYQERVAF